MENIAYTTKERRAISDAWNAISYAADCWDWTSPSRLRDALKQRDNRPVLEQKANLIGAFALGAGKPTHEIADLYHYAPSWVAVLLFGAAYAARTSDDAKARLPVILDKITAGRAAHDAALQRFLDR